MEKCLKCGKFRLHVREGRCNGCRKGPLYPKKCARCPNVTSKLRRGLCRPCYSRALYYGTLPERTYICNEPTMEELEAIIAEQMKCLPAWWEQDSIKYNGRNAPDIIQLVTGKD